MGVQAVLAAALGDIWRSWRCVALWPWPAVVYGLPHSRLTADDYRIFTALLKPGDFLLSKAEPYFLSNWGISGTVFKHLAVYTGAVKGARDKEDRHFITSAKSLGVDYEHTGIGLPGFFERTITHAISEGVVCQDLFDVFSHNDYVIAVRPSADPKFQQLIVDAALEQLGIGYNFDFTPDGPKELYCTELGVWCCKRAAIMPPETIRSVVDWKGKLMPLDRFKGDVTVADAFVKEFPVLCCSDSCKERGFHRSSRWSDAIRQKLLGVVSSNTRG